MAKIKSSDLPVGSVVANDKTAFIKSALSTTGGAPTARIRTMAGSTGGSGAAR
ncbi:hypothetical protein [Paractinoplanes rishiriensis]|uniref:hypothetical protein n=1 Tax=Paractinoplanes rishiriensis TaxID=1050105 RepID=UPI00194221C9|nr:hypothetical protein [Actinoplanes rishiriensis]